MLVSCVCVYIHTVARSNSCKNVVLHGRGKLPDVNTSSQLGPRSVEAANDVS